MEIFSFDAPYTGIWQIFQQKAFLYGMKPRIILWMKGLTNRFEIADKGLKKAPNLKKNGRKIAISYLMSSYFLQFSLSSSLIEDMKTRVAQCAKSPNVSCLS